MQRYLRAIATVLSCLPCTTFAEATHVSLSDEIDEISRLLNHQDFESAQEMGISLWTTYDESAFTSDLSYDQFIAWIQFLKTQSTIDISLETLVSQRLEYHPDEASRCALVTRLYGYSHPCEKPSKQSSYIDRVDYAFRLLLSHQQKPLARYIRGLERDVVTLQDMNDLGNLLAWYASYYPDYGSSIYPKTSSLGKKIIKKDPHWVNGYLLLMNGATDDTVKIQDLCDQMHTAYIGDAIRRDKVFESCDR